jgi:hypothetical protein
MSETDGAQGRPPVLSVYLIRRLFLHWTGTWTIRMSIVA